MADSDSFIDQNLGVGDTVSQEEIGRALAGVGASSTKDSFSESLEDETYDEIDQQEKKKLRYPENREGYGASITFTLMETKTFADAKGVDEGSSFSAMSKKFSEASNAAREARKFTKQSKEKSKAAARLASQAKEQAAAEKESIRGAGGNAGFGYGGLIPSAQSRQQASDAGKQATALEEKANASREKALALSREGTSQLASAIAEGGKNAERTTLPREDVSTIHLYLPISFQQTDGFQIAGTDLGILGASVFAGTANSGSIIKGIGEGISSGFGSIIDLANNNVNGLSAATVVSRLATKFAPTEVANAFNIAAGVTVNPNTRSTFRGVNLREYTFQFKFLPKSRKEAKDVESIIKLFRTYAYPETIEIGGVAAGYKFPDLFKIDIKVQMGEGKETIVGNKLKHCYLRSINTNYNPSSMTFHTDGKPVEIDLSLSFQEETTLSRKDILEGY